MAINGLPQFRLLKGQYLFGILDTNLDRFMLLFGGLIIDTGSTTGTVYVDKKIQDCQKFRNNLDNWKIERCWHNKDYKDTDMLINLFIQTFKRKKIREQ